MPVKIKAKDHSKYMQTTTHHNLTHLKKAPKKKDNFKKVIEWMIAVLIIAIIIIGFALEL